MMTVRLLNRRLFYGAVLLGTLGVGGCGGALYSQGLQFKAAHPDAIAPVQASGLADAVPQEEIGACGPAPPLSGIIPDCPFGLVCFSAACVNHDRCYSTCGTTQITCDQVFYWDMVSLCDDKYEPGDSRLDRCYELAYVYYRAVELYGMFFFQHTQTIVCDPDYEPHVTEIDAARLLTAVDPGPPPFEDVDDDLMPDKWEISVGLDPTDPADAFLDPDGDGLANLTEFIHDTDPFEPQ